MELFQYTGTVLNSAVKLKIPYLKTLQKGSQSYLDINKNYVTSLYLHYYLHLHKEKLLIRENDSFTYSPKVNGMSRDHMYYIFNLQNLTSKLNTK